MDETRRQLRRRYARLDGWILACALLVTAAAGLLVVTGVVLLGA